MMSDETRRALEVIGENRRRIPVRTVTWARKAREEGGTWPEIAALLDLSVQGLMRAVKRADVPNVEEFLVEAEATLRDAARE